VANLWVGVDIGKAHHHVAAADGDGRLVSSRKVDNDEPDILAVIAEVGAVGRPVCWAVDVTTGLAALLLTLLWRRQTEVRYVSGTVAFHMAAAFAGENKTDARDAVVIAHTVRMRPDIPVLQPTDRLLAELAVLTGHRADLVAQRVAALYRLQALLTGISPALEQGGRLQPQRPAHGPGLLADPGHDPPRRHRPDRDTAAARVRPQRRRGRRGHGHRRPPADHLAAG
jgi:hypothetical protein